MSLVTCGDIVLTIRSGTSLPYFHTLTCARVCVLLVLLILMLVVPKGAIRCTQATWNQGKYLILDTSVGFLTRFLIVCVFVVLFVCRFVCLSLWRTE